MKNPIESYFRAHLTMCSDLIAERAPRVGLREIERHWLALTDQYGDHGCERIRERALAVTRQVFGGEAAPRMAHLSVDPVSVVEADCYAEQLAAEYWANGVRPSGDPEWRAKLNQRYGVMVAQRLKQLERPARREAPAAQPVVQKTAKIVRDGNGNAIITITGPQQPPLELDSIVDEAVTRAVDARLQVREGPSGVLPAMHYMAVWRDGTDYQPGDVVSYRGTTWHCGLATSSKPGTDSTWQMMAKTDHKNAKTFSEDT